jgi:pimeloyl-ACP methyl ester carboxylesterase
VITILANNLHYTAPRTAAGTSHHRHNGPAGCRRQTIEQPHLLGAKAHYDCIKAFSETDQTEDLMKIDVPVLVMHSEDDQIVPFAAAGPLAAKLLKHGTLKTYQGLPHGMPTTHADVINEDLLAFIKS